MNYRDFAKKLITENEDNRLFAYDDATGDKIVPGYKMKGHPTIGVGRALDVKGISKDESYMLLQRDLFDAAKGIEAQNLSFWKELSYQRKAVLVDMAHNMGITGLMGFKQMMKALALKNYDKAALELKASSYFYEVNSRGKQNYCIMKFNRYFSDREARRYFENNRLKEKL